MNFPIDLLSFTIKKSFVDNPSLSPDLKTSKSFSVENFFPFKFKIYLGIGIRLYEKKKTSYKTILYL